MSPFHKSTRLRDCDYSAPGAYVVTIVARERRCLFGDILDDSIHLAPLGRIIEEEWAALRSHYSTVTTDAHVIMPNHLHGIIVITDDAKASRGIKLENSSAREVASNAATMGRISPQAGSLSVIVRGFKAGVSRRAKQELHLSGDVWHPRFHDHIIKDDKDLTNHQRYILDNPLNWKADTENPNVVDRIGNV